MISTTCSLKWVNELQHEILSQLIIRFTLGISLGQARPLKVEDEPDSDLFHILSQIDLS